MNQSSSVDTRGMGAGEIAILLWAAVVGTSFFTLAPVLVGALIDRMQLTVPEVGLIPSGEVAGSALGSPVGFLFGRRFPARATLTFCLVLAGVANLATATSHLFSTIALFRVVAGVGG